MPKIFGIIKVKRNFALHKAKGGRASLAQIARIAHASHNQKQNIFEMGQASYHLS